MVIVTVETDAMVVAMVVRQNPLLRKMIKFNNKNSPIAHKCTIGLFFYEFLVSLSFYLI